MLDGVVSVFDLQISLERKMTQKVKMWCNRAFTKLRLKVCVFFRARATSRQLKRRERLFLFRSLGMILAIICIVALCFGLLNHQETANFGDSYGVANAIFSGLAFLGVIFTIMLQSKELQLQREELTQTREEIRLQTEAFNEQNEVLALQRFEGTFFQLLSATEKVADAISADSSLVDFIQHVSSRMTTGRDDDHSFERAQSVIRDKGHVIYRYVLRFESILDYLVNSEFVYRPLYWRCLDAQPTMEEFQALVAWSAHTGGSGFLRDFIRFHVFNPAVIERWPGWKVLIERAERA